MENEQDRPDMGTSGDPFRGDLRDIETLPALPAPATAEEGVTTLGIFGSIITAQRVIKPRSLAEIQQRMRVLAAFSGGSYIYSWPVKNRKTGRTTTIEGPTVKMANDLAREWGNCLVDVRVIDERSHWLYYARFTDLETGYSYTRPYRQRKGQETGMADAARAEDLIFQIGASKAIRNCILNSLSTLVDYTLEQARNNLLHWVDNNAEQAKAYVEKITVRFDIDLERVEAVVGKKQKNWTNREYARVLTELRGIDEGLSDVEDLYPTDKPLAEMAARPAKPKPAKPKAAAEAKEGDAGSESKQRKKRRNKEQMTADAMPAQSKEEQEAKARAVAAAYGHVTAAEEEQAANAAAAGESEGNAAVDPAEDHAPEPEPSETESEAGEDLGRDGNIPTRPGVGDPHGDVF